MKKALITVFAALAIFGWCAPSHSATGNLNLLLGGKSLEKDDWDPVENQSAVSFHFDVTPEGWPVALSFDLLGSAGIADMYVSGVPVEFTGSTSEFDFGVRKFFGDESDFAGFIGGGLGSIGAQWEAKEKNTGLTYTTEDSALGFWIDGGFQGRFLGALNLGIDLRYSQATVHLDEYDVEAGGFTSGIYIGYGW